MRHHHPIVEADAAEPPVEETPEEPAPTPVPKPAPPRHKPHAPSPHDLAELSGAFAMTANVADPEPEAEPVYSPPHLNNHDHEDVATERGLRGLVGGGASQVGVAAALRARDAARPSDADLAAAEENLVIVRRGWVPREELPRPGRR
jgi:hypothetical protein